MSPIEQITKTCARLGIKPGERVLAVRIGPATLQFFSQGRLVKSYGISTSRRPPSNRKNSLGTPRGLHEIAERIGAGQPPGMVFKARIPTGRHFSELSDSADDRDNNLITSRILWLRGLEPGVNRGGEVDTYDRHVYIHGTNQGDRVGEPLSSGCILMRDLDIIELFETVRAGDLVWIAD
ncbi:MAG: L,D-transpeptidase [Verrucomicrobia bacterium]|nr:L,D-transpeptidase [Verrucomicrobiota bacterium]